ncbi:MAG: hypothetical protein ACRBB0_23035 [Pelagimonas sp.]|uniref:hypothetical protein n=1 Tax=Pelagimonas sp. TaxID=2073170 RepID=UPI003D6B07B4
MIKFVVTVIFLGFGIVFGALQTIGTKFEPISRYLVGAAYLLRPLSRDVSVTIDGIPVPNMRIFLHDSFQLVSRVVIFLQTETGDYSLLNVFPFNARVGQSINTPQNAVMELPGGYFLVRDIAWPIAILGQPMKSPFKPSVIDAKIGKRIAFSIVTNCQSENCLVGGRAIPTGDWNITFDRTTDRRNSF